jgi:hypothetical protein
VAVCQSATPGQSCSPPEITQRWRGPNRTDSVVSAAVALSNRRGSPSSVRLLFSRPAARALLSVQEGDPEGRRPNPRSPRAAPPRAQRGEPRRTLKGLPGNG